ncbi:FecR family protein [Ramlibacter sp. PS4R-6]|uniref:FecR family protein n=1 Tax=Ramlibacter sp. PS4R-6 TaxID=3133438 RepID=UPI0030B06CBD
MFPQKRYPLAARAALGAWLLLAAAAAGAQVAGQVEFSRGVGFAQTAGQTPRTLGQGLDLREGDRLTTSDGGSAIIKMQDGTRMTVRPNSELVISQYQFKENANDNGMVMQLVRGGFRAVTGLISKSSPNAARVQTSTATIGIRGTDFDARVCTRECGQESQQLAAAVARPNTVVASAKIANAVGEVFALDTAGQRRRLVEGGSIYPGDVVETLPGARAVLAFRDDSRVSVGSNSRFRVDNFVYDEKNAGEGRFLASILRGSVRALTGLIAKADNRNASFSTATATIGIRGTGFDAVCEDASCNNVTLWTWLGSIAVTPQGTTALQLLQSGQGLFISPQGIQPVLNAPPMGDNARPDTVNIPPKLFGNQEVSDAQEGLFVFVRDGHIEIATANQVLQLGKGEAGFAGNNGDTARPNNIPKFIDFDKIPLPNSKNPLLVSVLADAGVKQQNQCK